jgi:stearoyl-CoA desaturase (delta-9 desaturase)
MTQAEGAEPRSPANFGRGRRTIASPYFHRRQRRHFALFDLIPTLGTIGAIGLLPWLPLTGSSAALCAAMWLMTGLGISVGFHRLFAHRAFAASPPVASALVILGSMAARGPMFSWAAMHRRHHECSDREGDMHSPNLGHRNRRRGWWHAHIGWIMRHDYPNVGHYIPDLLTNRRLAAVNRHYFRWVALGLALPMLAEGLICGSLAGALSGFLWGGMVRMFLVAQTMSCINSLCHLFGVQPFASVADRSGNLAWLALPSWGETWHNNHHAFPNSAAFGLYWYQPDPGLWFIKGLQMLGLATAVRRPKEAQVAARRRLAAAAESDGDCGRDGAQ